MAKQTAQLNYLHIAPRKVRAIVDMIRGLPVAEAEAQLLYERRRPAKALLKLLRSALANAKNNQRVAPEKLYIERITVGQGPMFKRYLPRARGSATPIQKKTSQVMMVLAENQNLPAPRFHIVVPKKTKLPEEAKAKKKKSVQDDKEKSSSVLPHTKKSSLLRRIFRRKTG